jgi:ubiquinone/menaquinone biosynthesis C-methylase UbiE
MNQKSRIGRRETASQRRARRERDRQLVHQRAKAIRTKGLEEELIAVMQTRATRARELLERIRPLPPDARVLEVGSGAHGLIFYFGGTHRIGCDPLAAHYASLFHARQRRVPLVAALGEALPFPDVSFDVVLCTT